MMAEAHRLSGEADFEAGVDAAACGYGQYQLSV